jgi:hypothetical protein
MGIMLSQWLSKLHHSKWQDSITKLIGIFLWLLVIGHAVLFGVLIYLAKHTTVSGIIALSIAIIAAIMTEKKLRQDKRCIPLVTLTIVLATLTVPISQMQIHEQQRGGFIAADELVDLTLDQPERIILARKVAYDQPELFYYAARPTSSLPASLDVISVMNTHPHCTLVLHPSEYAVMHEALTPYLTKQKQIAMHDGKLWVVWLDITLKSK